MHWVHAGVSLRELHQGRGLSQAATHEVRDLMMFEIYSTFVIGAKPASSRLTPTGAGKAI
ncbi:hypothetical protein JDS79_45055 [Bacillus cereus]|nr:hypothetical protein [Bacillus cereus]